MGFDGAINKKYVFRDALMCRSIKNFLSFLTPLKFYRETGATHFLCTLEAFSCFWKTGLASQVAHPIEDPEKETKQEVSEWRDKSSFLYEI